MQNSQVSKSAEAYVTITAGIAEVYLQLNDLKAAKVCCMTVGVPLYFTFIVCSAVLLDAPVI